MLFLFGTIIIIASIILGVIILIQNPKGGGISSSFDALNQIGGVKQTSEGIERVTWGLALVLVVLCLASTPASRAGGGGKNKGEKPMTSIPMDQMQGGSSVLTAPAGDGKTKPE